MIRRRFALLAALGSLANGCYGGALLETAKAEAPINAGIDSTGSNRRGHVAIELSDEDERGGDELFGSVSIAPVFRAGLVFGPVSVGVGANMELLGLGPTLSLKATMTPEDSPVHAALGVRAGGVAYVLAPVAAGWIEGELFAPLTFDLTPDQDLTLAARVAVQELWIERDEDPVDDRLLLPGVSVMYRVHLNDVCSLVTEVYYRESIAGTWQGDGGFTVGGVLAFAFDLRRLPDDASSPGDLDLP